jgi:hypothetical protein
MDAVLYKAEHYLRRASQTEDFELRERLVEMAEEFMRRAEAGRGLREAKRAVSCGSNLPLPAGAPLARPDS